MTLLSQLLLFVIITLGSLLFFDLVAFLGLALLIVTEIFYLNKALALFNTAMGGL